MALRVDYLARETGQNLVRNPLPTIAAITTVGVALTMLAVSTQTVAVIGPTLGGLLIAVGGWHATFLVNAPLALACLVLGAWRLPKEPLAARDASSARTHASAARIR